MFQDQINQDGGGATLKVYFDFFRVKYIDITRSINRKMYLRHHDYVKLSLCKAVLLHGFGAGITLAFC